MNEFAELKRKFDMVKNMGWILCDDCTLKLRELLDDDIINCRDAVVRDWNGSNGYIELFSANPDSHVFELKKIRDVYGLPDEEFPYFKVFNASLFHSFKITQGKYSFRTCANKEKKVLEMRVYNVNNKLIDNSIFWSFDLINEFYQRIKNVVIVKAQKRKYLDKVYFRYLDIAIYSIDNFDDFLSAIVNDYIMIAFNLDVYRSGKETGRKYDSEPCFCIREKDFDKVFSRSL